MKGDSSMKKILMMISLLAMTTMAALAADIDGKWVAELQGQKGPQTQTLVLKADGMKLTGSLDGGRGGATDISEGMIHGNDVTFKVVREFNGMKIEQNYKGTLAGGELKVTREANPNGKGGPQEMTFKKQ
jgi:hypothetical protein